MKYFNNPVTWLTIESVPFVMRRFDDRLRLIVGLGINVLGAGVLLVDGWRCLSL